MLYNAATVSLSSCTAAPLSINPSHTHTNTHSEPPHSPLPPLQVEKVEQDRAGKESDRNARIKKLTGQGQHDDKAE